MDGKFLLMCRINGSLSSRRAFLVNHPWLIMFEFHDGDDDSAGLRNITEGEIDRQS